MTGLATSYVIYKKKKTLPSLKHKTMQQAASSAESSTLKGF